MSSNKIPASHNIYSVLIVQLCGAQGILDQGDVIVGGAL